MILAILLRCLNITLKKFTPRKLRRSILFLSVEAQIVIVRVVARTMGRNWNAVGL